MKNKRIDAYNIKTGIDSRLAGLYIDDSMKSNILNKLESNHVDITVYNPKKKISLKRITTIIIAACLCLAITIPAIGAIIPGGYNQIFNTQSQNNTDIQTAPPDTTGDDGYNQIIHESGIEFSIVSAYYDSEYLQITFELTDTTEKRLAADCFTYNMIISGQNVVECTWRDVYNEETGILSVYMVCYNLELTGTNITIELDTLFDTRTDKAISGYYRKTCEVTPLYRDYMDPMMSVGDFLIDGFAFSPLGFSITGTGTVNSDLLFTLSIYMLDGSYHTFAGGLQYTPENHISWLSCIQASYAVDGTEITSEIRFWEYNQYSNNTLSQKICFDQPIPYEGMSHIVLSYLGTEQTFTTFM